MELLKFVHQLQQTGKFCDVELIMEDGGVIMAHACILAAASETLKSWIENGNIDLKEKIPVRCLCVFVWGWALFLKITVQK